MNQMTAPESEQNEIIPPSIAAGQRLREAREGMGLSREDVARELRLQEKLIAALEAGELGQLPPVTFIGGYLRAYARLLGLPAEQLIAEYLPQQATSSDYRSIDRTGMPKMTSRDPKYRITTYTVGAVVIVLFAAWWANQRFSFVSLEQPQEAATLEPEQDLEATLPPPMPLYQEPPAEELPAGSATATSPAAAVTTMPAAPAAKQAAPTSTVPAAPVLQAPATGTATAVPPAESAKPAPTAPTLATEPLAASVPQSSLMMEFQADSWTQVEDANGRVLAYQTVAAGRKLQLHGVAPFKVFLGYAPGVLVYYNGTLFPHADYHHGELARFRVGSSQDNRPLVR